VVAGMSVGTLFTLFVLPAVYTVLAKDTSRPPFDPGRGARPGLVTFRQ